MQYSQARVYSLSDPCTNVPIHCSICPPAYSGNLHTVWKYNYALHLHEKHRDTHLTDGQFELPAQLWVDTFISQCEEAAIAKVDAETTRKFREDYNLPGSDDLPIVSANGSPKRPRSLTLHEALAQDHTVRKKSPGLHTT
jgi:hypothetical protein